MKKFSLRPMVVLLVFGGVVVGSLLLLDQLTSQQRTEQAQQALRQKLNQVSPSQLKEDHRWEPLSHSFAEHSPIKAIYPIFHQGYQGAVVKIVVPDGYNGPISLLAGIRANHQLHRIRILQHQETAGLGDRIEAGKSSWLKQFVGKTMSQTLTVEQHLSGATVTERALIRGLNQALASLRPVLNQLKHSSP